MNSRQTRFVQEYLKSPNATEAAVRAGYSRRSAKFTGSRLLTRPDVIEAIGAAQAARLERVTLEAADVIDDLAKLAFLDPADLFDSENELLPIHAMPEHARKALRRVRVYERELTNGTMVRSFSIVFWDKIGALALLAKHVGLPDARIEMTHVHKLVERLTDEELLAAYSGLLGEQVGEEGEKSDGRSAI